MILAFETATEVCSVAIGTGESRIGELRETGRGIHSEKTFLFAEELLKRHSADFSTVTQVLISRGPGQYTGLRIGAAGVKGMLFGRQIPLWSIGTLEGFAAGVILKEGFSGRLHSVIDARREHLYHQLFTVESERVSAGEAEIIEISKIDQMIGGGDRIVGTGLERLVSYGEPGVQFFDRESISAANLIRARKDRRFSGWFQEEEPAQFEPDYLTAGQVNNSRPGSAG